MSCSKENCEKDGHWRPVFELRPSKKGPITPSVLTQLVLCDDHKASSTLADFLSSEGFTKIVKFMRENGKVAPVQRNTTLTWEKLSKAKLETVTPMVLTTPPDSESDLPF